MRQFFFELRYNYLMYAITFDAGDATKAWLSWHPDIKLRLERIFNDVASTRINQAFSRRTQRDPGTLRELAADFTQKVAVEFYEEGHTVEVSTHETNPVCHCCGRANPQHR